jgi:hypothetical protein
VEVEGHVHLGVGVEVEGQVHLCVGVEVGASPFRSRGAGGGTDKSI